MKSILYRLENSIQSNKYYIHPKEEEWLKPNREEGVIRDNIINNNYYYYIQWILYWRSKFQFRTYCLNLLPTLSLNLHTPLLSFHFFQYSSAFRLCWTSYFHYPSIYFRICRPLCSSLQPSTSTSLLNPVILAFNLQILNDLIPLIWNSRTHFYCYFWNLKNSFSKFITIPILTNNSIICYTCE